MVYDCAVGLIFMHSPKLFLEKPCDRIVPIDSDYYFREQYVKPMPAINMLDLMNHYHLGSFVVVVLMDYKVVHPAERSHFTLSDYH